MLMRQRIILELLRVAARPVSKLELMKWAFVLANESRIADGAAFYEFLPYHYGPYSFCLQRDLGTLVSSGLVTESDKSWAWNTSGEAPNPPKQFASKVRNVVDRFRQWSSNEVIDYVYRSYPAYTVNSKRERLALRKVASPAIFTSGYEGLQIDGFLDRLVQAGIGRLIDVRNNPVARRYGFHKSTLQRLCGNLDIDYIHVPELGIASAERQELNSVSDYLKLFDRYEQQTLPQHASSLKRVAELMQERSSVLVCMEADACRCHRSRLANTVSRMTGLNSVHLGDKT